MIQDGSLNLLTARLSRSLLKNIENDRSITVAALKVFPSRESHRADGSLSKGRLFRRRWTRRSARWYFIPNWQAATIRHLQLPANFRKPDSPYGIESESH